MLLHHRFVCQLFFSQFPDFLIVNQIDEGSPPLQRINHFCEGWTRRKMLIKTSESVYRTLVLYEWRGTDRECRGLSVEGEADRIGDL